MTPAGSVMLIVGRSGVSGAAAAGPAVSTPKGRRSAPATHVANTPRLFTLMAVSSFSEPRLASVGRSDLAATGQARPAREDPEGFRPISQKRAVRPT